MINANELKPDNFIYFTNALNNNGKRIAVVDSIKKSIASFQEKHDHGVDIWLPLSWCEGIPITPALLYSVGFSTPPNHLSMVVYKDGVTIDYHHGKFRLRDNSRITIDYLHQLQNIYFALTGEELTINNEHLQSTS